MDTNKTTDTISRPKTTISDRLTKEIEQRKTAEVGLAAILAKLMPFMSGSK